MEYLVAVIVGLLGLLAYSRNKQLSAEALLENLETKEKILDLEKLGAQAHAELILEEEKRKLADSELNKQLNEKPSKEELEDFFKRP